MTYDEIKTRLAKVEVALTALQTGSYQDKNFEMPIGETINQLQLKQKQLQEQLTALEAQQSLLGESVRVRSDRSAVKAEGMKTVIVGEPSKTASDVQQDADLDPATKQSAVDAVKKAKKGDKIEVPVKEDHHQNPNDESDMAKVQLHNVAKYSIELLKMIKNGQQLDAWVQDKLSIAFDYIDTIKHYMEGEEYLASTDAPVDAPVDEAMDINDPIMMKLRAAKMKTYKTEPQAAPKANTPKANTNDSKLAALEKYRAQVMRDMEQEAEPEGGPIADKYGAELNKIDKAIAKLSGHGEWGPEAENPYMSKAEIERRAAKLTEAYVPSNIKEFAKRKGVSRLVNTVAGWAEKVGARITGGTAIGKYYDTLILDMGYQTADIYINCEKETVELYGEPVRSFSEFKNVFMEEESRKQAEHDEETLNREQGLEEGMSDQEYADAKEAERLNKHPEKKTIKKVQAMMTKEKSLKEDWGGSDQAAMNQSIHRDLGKPTTMPSPFDAKLRAAAEDAVDFYWEDWDEYQTDRDGLIDNAVRSYLRGMFRDTFNQMVRMFEPINEAPDGMYYISVSVRDAKKALAILDDMYRNQFEINGTNVYYFTDEGAAYDALMDFGAHDIEVEDTNLNQDDEEMLQEVAELPTATDEILGKFPSLKRTLESLLTNQYHEFVEAVEWIAPKPSTFRVTLTNGETFELKWMGRGFQATIAGKKYFLSNVDEFQQSLDKLGELLKTKQPQPGDGTEGGDEAPADDAFSEEPAEETGDEETL